MKGQIYERDICRKKGGGEHFQPFADHKLGLVELAGHGRDEPVL
jgi:hypothetical protein